MKVVETTLDGVLIIESPVFRDDRGHFVEVYHHEKFRSLGLPTEFVQDNQSHSTRGVLRRSAPTFGNWFGITMCAGDGRQLWIPPGFAHGFLVLSDSADVSYKCTTPYNGASDASLLWSDPIVGIQWPLAKGERPHLSAKDQVAPLLSAVVPFP